PPRGECRPATRNTRPSAAKAMRWKMHSGQGSRPQANCEKIAKPIRATQARKPARHWLRKVQLKGFRLIGGLWQNGGQDSKKPRRAGRGFLLPQRTPGLLGGRLRAVDELDVRHRGVVAVAETALEDAEVAARTLAV